MIAYVTGCAHHHRLRYQDDCGDCATSFDMCATLDMHDLLLLETYLADVMLKVVGQEARNTRRADSEEEASEPTVSQRML